MHGSSSVYSYEMRKGGGGSPPPPKILSALRASVWSKNKGGPSPECATGQRFLQLFLGTLEPVSLLSKRYQLSGIELTYD